MGEHDLLHSVICESVFGALQKPEREWDREEGDGFLLGRAEDWAPCY